MAHNITDEEITRLAREYAEEVASTRHYDTEFKHQLAIMGLKQDFLTILDWLLRSHCLVEKSRVEEEYYEATFAMGNVDPCSETWATNLAQKSLLETLFGDTLKEEGR